MNGCQFNRNRIQEREEKRKKQAWLNERLSDAGYTRPEDQQPH